MRIEFSIVAAAAAAGLLVFQLPRARAADDLKPQQQRMKVCNTQAEQKRLEGGERNHFMRSCLKGKNGNGHKLSAHQKRSEDCTNQAREQGLQGAERRGFMSECEKPAVKQQVAEDKKMKSCERRARDRRLDEEETRNYVQGCANGSAAASGG